MRYIKLTFKWIIFYPISVLIACIFISVSIIPLMSYKKTGKKTWILRFIDDSFTVLNRIEISLKTK